MSNVFKRKVRAHIKPSEDNTPMSTPVEDVPKVRRPYGAKDAVIGPRGLVYAPSGVYSHQGEMSSPEKLPSDVDLDEAAPSVHVPTVIDLDGEDQTTKKERQWRKWSEEVIPALLKPYLGLLRESSGLRDMSSVRKQDQCSGCTDGHLLEVSCIFFEKIEMLVLCTCKNPALQLLSRGLFPCAPLEPSLAVDLNVLDFAKELFVNAAPNTTAWCDTLEGFLSSRNFKLTTRNALRTRFGNAMHWYAALTNKKNLMLRDYLDLIRGSILQMDGDESEVHEPHHVPHGIHAIPSSATEADQNANDALDRPSEYLRERCPLCFGGQNWQKPDDLVDAIVCIDACFTQKRRKSQGNAWQAPNVHPETIFVPSEDVQAMEDLVEKVRPSKTNAKQSGKAKKSDETKPDYEPNMRVPTSVLDECNNSFTAADERRAKASTVFFADTGLMGLLCRHDRVLWLANMTSPGENQYYALALLEKLFANIPKSMRIGVLYDIGCQLHRSCENYGFLKDILDRIVFGISVFHAYGHQWPCQLIYHPRKCVGFGLTDGEGCERFWSAIKALIPSCRVSTYFNRIYTIDTKVKHLDQKSLSSLGSWLQRKWISTTIKKNEASTFLDDLYTKGHTEDSLRKEWNNQIVEQTKPLKRQSKNIANKAIEEILALTRNITTWRKELAGLTDMLKTGEYEDGLSADDIAGQVEDTEQKIKNAQRNINSKKEKLSVDGRLSLTKLLGNEFLKKRLNALALKQRIRDRLRNRKFEIEALERAYRTVINDVNQAKLQKHANQQVKRKETGIQSHARNYNKLCSELEDMIKAKKDIPRGAIAPLQIDITKLFHLDVDDTIWLDIGLTDDDDDKEVPQWLGNEDVRNGIKALLQLDRCLEEERRLKAEKLSMQQWFQEEWKIIETAIENSTPDPDLVYQLQARRNTLLRLCVLWEPCVRIIPQEIDNSWGPSDEELHYAQKAEYTASMSNIDDLLDEGQWDEDMEEMISAELLDNTVMGELHDDDL